MDWKKVLYIALIVFGIFLIIKGIYLKQLDYDEAIHLNVASNLGKFGKPLFYESCYRNSRIGFEHPFLYLWVLVLAAKLSQNLFMMRLIVFFLISIPLIIAVFYFTKKFFNKSAAYLAVLFLIFSRYFFIHSGNFLLDLASSLFLFLGLCFYLYSLQKKSLRLLFLSALVSAIAICIKESALLILPIIITHYLFVRFIKKKKEYTKYIFTYTLFIIVFLLIYLIYSKFAGAGIISPLYNSNERFLFIKTPWKYIPLLKYLSIFLFNIGVLPVVLALVYILTSKYKKDKTILLIFSVLIPFLFFSSVLERSNRYYVTLLPEIMVLAGVELSKFLKKPNKVLAIIFALALIIYSYNIITFSKGIISQTKQENLYKQIGLEIKNLNISNDKVFLANNGPVISYYAGNIHYYLPFLYNYSYLINMLEEKQFINMVVIKPYEWLPFLNNEEKEKFRSYINKSFKVIRKNKDYMIFLR